MSGGVLVVRDAHVQYGSIRALQGVSLEARPGAIVAVVGTNGAGKSTLLHAIAGLVPLTAGRIECPAGRDITRMPIHRRVAEVGVILVPEAGGVLQRMTVEENLGLGAERGRRRRPERTAAARVAEVMKLFPPLVERRRELAGNLSGGERQMLMLGRALAAEPDVLLLDEPSTGLAPRVVETVFVQLAAYISTRAISLVLVEQNTELALDVAEYVYLIERGTVRLEGRSGIVRADPMLQQTFLGA